jgi:hypothetical protein
MVPRSRLWLLAPVAALCAADVALTLTGQPHAYWADDFGSAVEGNPLAAVVLRHSPGLFVGAAGCWLACLSVLIVFGPPRLAAWVAVVFAAAHAVGGASWLLASDARHVLATGAYLAAAAVAASWCWSRCAGPIS